MKDRNPLYHKGKPPFCKDGLPLYQYMILMVAKNALIDKTPLQVHKKTKDRLLENEKNVLYSFHETFLNARALP